MSIFATPRATENDRIKELEERLKRSEEDARLRRKYGASLDGVQLEFYRNIEIKERAIRENVNEHRRKKYAEKKARAEAERRLMLGMVESGRVCLYTNKTRYPLKPNAIVTCPQCGADAPQVTEWMSHAIADVLAFGYQDERRDEMAFWDRCIFDVFTAPNRSPVRDIRARCPGCGERFHVTVITVPGDTIG